MKVPRIKFITAIILLFDLLTPLSASDEWKFYCHREALAPLHQKEMGPSGEPKLILAGQKKSSVNGSWRTLRSIPDTDFISFSVVANFQSVDEPRRSIVTNLIWKDAAGKKVEFTEFPKAQVFPSSAKMHFEQIYKVPPGAVEVQIDLIYRWDADGKVIFEQIELLPSQDPAVRMVRLATVHHRPRQSSISENLAAFENYAAEAGTRGADIVCLPEGITLVGTGQTYIDVAEKVPGPTTSSLGKVASKYNMYIVAGLIEKDGPEIYNTAVLIDRQGKLAGKYRKISLPREEIEGGITPGHEFPVFDTDFGTIGMMICWDVTFPEVARRLAKKGAEIIFLPIWGGNFTLAQARAIENQVYLVSSTYDMRSAVLGLEGEVLAEGLDDSPVAVEPIDLNSQKLWPWLGEFKNRIWQEGPPQADMGKY